MVDERIHDRRTRCKQSYEEEHNFETNKVLALCRFHHNQQHNIGMDSFNKLHHLENAWVDVDEKLNKMLKGERVDGRAT